jgi:hypothetical protein
MWATPENFRVKIGGAYFINCRDLIVAHGESLFRLKRREDDGLLAVDFDIYDPSGSKVATVRNGNIVDHDREAYEPAKEHHRYTLTEKATGRVVCDIRKAAKAEDGSEIEIAVDIYTKKGLHFVATPEFSAFPGAVLQGVTISDCGTGISIG